MPVKVIIFDWDGTLVDSVSHIVDAVQAAARENQCVAPDADAVRMLIGLPLAVVLRTLFPQAGESAMRQLRESYVTHYLRNARHTQWFPGVEAYVRRTSLDGAVQLAIATGKSRIGLERMLRQLDAGSAFSITRTACDARAKPDPDMVWQIVQALSASKEHVLLVGDTVLDLQMAQDAGVASVAVSYGAGESAALAAMNPLTVCDSSREMIAYLESWCG